MTSVTCDEASDNRRTFSLHGTGKDLVYKTVNVFCQEKLPIFFVSDLSHLNKTIRNCFSRGKVWVSVYSVCSYITIEIVLSIFSVI